MNINDFGMPHTSIGGDREYGSAEWREYFNTLYENGVVPGRDNELEVKPQGAPNKTVYIDLGAIFINGAIRIVDSVINLSFTDNTSGSTRIDRVVARLNLQEATRKLEFAVKEGDPGGGAPALTQTDEIHELSLAQVELSNGYSTITTSEITDERIYSKIKVMFDADFLDGQLPSYYLDRANHTGTQPSSTISDFAATVRSTVLNGLSTATNAVISAADSILTALGKLQAQITANKNTADTHISSTSNPHSVDKADVGLGSVANYGVASQAEADAGAVDTKYMTPLKTMQAMVARDSKGQIVPGTLIQNFSNLVYNKGSGYDQWFPMGSITINPQNEPHCLLRIIPIQSTSLYAVRLKDGSGNFYFSTTPDPEDSDPPVSELDGYFPNLISTYNKGSITLYVEGFTPLSAEQTWELDFELYSAKKGVWE